MEIEQICYICKSPDCRITTDDHEFVKIVDCKRCGMYSINDLDIRICDFSDVLKTSVISYWLRNNKSESAIHLDKNIIENILKNNSLPQPKEQIDSLLLYLGDRAIKPSEKIEAEIAPITSIIGAVDENDVRYHLYHLWRNNLLFSVDSLSDTVNYGKCDVQLTHEGWDRYYELKSSNKDSKLAFMAMQFDNTLLQKIFSDFIIPAVQDTGFVIRKVDDVKRADLIDNKIRVEISKSKFVIADFSDENRGAYWEAGFASGKGIAVIYICEKEQFEKLGTHFDINHQSTIKWEKEPSTWARFAENLKDTIRATIPEAKTD